MSDASGTYASPTGSELRSGGAGQQQGIDEGYENVSFQLDAGEQNSGQEHMRRASTGTMATQLGGAGTPTTTQQESPAPTADPLLQSLLISVRLFTQKANLIAPPGILPQPFAICPTRTVTPVLLQKHAGVRLVSHATLLSVPPLVPQITLLT